MQKPVLEYGEEEMKGAHYNLGKTCSVCGVAIVNRNVGGQCALHRDRSGQKNPFWGKRHSLDTIEKARIKCAESSKALWGNPVYRARVITGVSKPRRLGFKQEQSDRVTQWYLIHPGQKALRSACMKKTWSDGRMVQSRRPSCCRSKLEIKFIGELKERLDLREFAVLRDKSCHYFPDAILDRDGVIVEFLGDYWHANPKKYRADDVVHHGILAKNIWDRDDRRVKGLERMGYKVMQVWGADYKRDPAGTVDSLCDLFDREACSL